MTKIFRKIFQTKDYFNSKYVEMLIHIWYILRIQLQLRKKNIIHISYSTKVEQKVLKEVDTLAKVSVKNDPRKKKNTKKL